MLTRIALAAVALSLVACGHTSPTPAPVVPVAATATPAAAAAPPPAWQQGRTPDQASSTLAPVAGSMTATPVSEIPIANFKLPPGFKAEVWATGMPGVRAMVRGDSGKIYVGTRGIGRVYEITDSGGAAHQPRRGRQAHAAGRRGDARRLALRVRDRQGAALRRHRDATRTRSRWT